MQYSQAHPNDAAEIEHLFIKTFSDSEGHTEGEMIGRLARDFMSGAPDSDLYCFIARENEQIVGSIFFSRTTFGCEIKSIEGRAIECGRGIFPPTWAICAELSIS